MFLNSQLKYSNDTRIKTDFVSQTLRESALEIRIGQDKVVGEWNLFDTGELESWMKGHFSVAPQNAGAKLTMRYLKYARFLDIPNEKRTVKSVRREGYHLYNRIAFGIVYNKTLNEIRYGLTDDVREKINAAINKAMRQSMTEN